MNTVKTYTEQQLLKVEEFLGIQGLLANLESLESSRKVIDAIEASVVDVDMFTTKKWDDHYQLGFYRIFLYCIAKSICNRDGIAIETGVLHGMSTAYILNAVQQQGSSLVSIDLPSFEDEIANQDGYDSWLPPGKTAGWMVDPDHEAWNLILGDTKDLLPKSLSENNVQLFIHDSDHSYEHMWFEMEQAFLGVVPGGVIVVDNIEHSDCFVDFVKAKCAEGLILDHFAGSADQALTLTNRQIGVLKT